MSELRLGLWYGGLVYLLTAVFIALDEPLTWPFALGMAFGLWGLALLLLLCEHLYWK